MDKSIRRGQTYEETIIADDETAEEIQLLVSDDEGTILINETATFADVDGKRTATITTNDTDHEVGVYKYMFWITYDGGLRLPLPNVDDCEGDCALPKFTICESITTEVS